MAAWRLGCVLTAALLIVAIAMAAASGACAQGAKDVAGLNKMVQRLYRLGKYHEATPPAEQLLALSMAALGAEHPETIAAASNLALLYKGQGRLADAEPLFRRAVTALERVRGNENRETIVAVNNLAQLYADQNRPAEAEPLFRRALSSAEKVLGAEDATTLASIHGLAGLYGRQGRYAEAEALYVRAFGAADRVLGADHPQTIALLNDRAVLYRFQGRYGEAEPLYKRSLAASERLRGMEHPATLQTVNNLAGLYNAQGRYAEAEPLYRRALAGRERALGPMHPDMLFSMATLAELYFKQRDWSQAARLWRASTAGIAARTRNGALGSRLTGKKASEAEQLAWQFSSLVRTVYHLGEEGHSSNAAEDVREMFQTAQWALSSQAANSMAQMAARSARGGGPLAQMVRERQDLLAEWQQRDMWRNAALGQETAERDAQAEAENAARLTAIAAQVAAIDKRLTQDFPDYAELANPEPLAVEEVQAQLRANEALVLILHAREWKPTPEETFLWVVTKTDVRWVRADLGGSTLAREVQALRCGLDSAAWDGPQCRNLLGVDYTEADAEQGKAPPFELARAHALYKALFRRVEDLIKGKHLLIVPSGPLTQLPFQVLVGSPVGDGGFRQADWFGRRHALSVLPAVSSLKALRRVARPGGAAKAMIGFGNPLLDGPGGRYAVLAQLARDNQQCQEAALQQVASLTGLRGVRAVETSGGLARVHSIRKQMPLPETAYELCTVARYLKADAAELRLGARATETEVKALSASGQLGDYRIVHFATHGVLAGELSGVNEPGLLMTPPAEATPGDDGYLSMSEIASLKLNADWVILSACNTAAGDASGAQALSGLARGFIYAQARALLVSHWAVNSSATVNLITGAMAEISRDPTVGRAEAMRRSMLALIDRGKPYEAHPAFWAPFVVVGEGGR